MLSVSEASHQNNSTKHNIDSAFDGEIPHFVRDDSLVFTRWSLSRARFFHFSIYIFTSFFKYCPVYESAQFATCSGVPSTIN